MILEDDGAGNVNNVLTVDPVESALPVAEAEPEQPLLAAPAEQNQPEPEPERTETQTAPETLVEKAEVVVEDHIPDVAPPPYSPAEHEHSAVSGSFPTDAEPAPTSAPIDNKPAKSDTTKEAGPSWLSRK